MEKLTYIAIMVILDGVALVFALAFRLLGGDPFATGVFLFVAFLGAPFLAHWCTKDDPDGSDLFGDSAEDDEKVISIVHGGRKKP